MGSNYEASTVSAPSPYPELPGWFLSNNVISLERIREKFHRADTVRFTEEPSASGAANPPNRLTDKYLELRDTAGSAFVPDLDGSLHSSYHSLWIVSGSKDGIHHAEPMIENLTLDLSADLVVLDSLDSMALEQSFGFDFNKMFSALKMFPSSTNNTPLPIARSLIIFFQDTGMYKGVEDKDNYNESAFDEIITGIKNGIKAWRSKQGSAIAVFYTDYSSPMRDKHICNHETSVIDLDCHRGHEYTMVPQHISARRIRRMNEKFLTYILLYLKGRKLSLGIGSSPFVEWTFLKPAAAEFLSRKLLSDGELDRIARQIGGRSLGRSSTCILLHDIDAVLTRHARAALPHELPSTPLERLVGLNKYETDLLRSVISPGKLAVSYDDVILDQATKGYAQYAISSLNVFPEVSSKPLQDLLRSNGMLLYGPPGTGKTHFCRAIASSANAKYHVISVSSATMSSKWVGETEKHISALFSLARRLSPCIIFIDEADSMFYRRTSSDMVWQRSSLNQILQEMDGLDSGDSSRPRPMVIAATNRPLDLDEAFLRRLQHKIYFKLPPPAQRHQILAHYLHKDDLADGASLEDLVDATDGYSGSDLANFCAQAARAWSFEQVSVADGNNATGVKKVKVLLTSHHFRIALDRSTATTSTSALEQFEIFAKKFNHSPITSKQTPQLPETLHNEILSFDYRPLDRNALEIRVLDLHPAPSMSNPLYCTLRHVPLRESKYSALSYVWGQQTENSSVLNVSDYHNSGPQYQKTIGANLSKALLHLRDPHRILTIWVDAVCINQQSDEEKSWQVQLMSEIYNSATVVHVWLGPTIDSPIANPEFILNHATHLRKLVAEFVNIPCKSDFHEFIGMLLSCREQILGENTKTIIAGIRKQRLGGNTESVHLQPAETQHELLKMVQAFKQASVSMKSYIFGQERELISSFHTLARSSWWRRVWVRQEFLLARSVIFHLGTESTPASSLLIVFSLCLMLILDNGFTPSQDIFPAMEVLSMYNYTPQPGASRYNYAPGSIVTRLGRESSPSDNNFGVSHLGDLDSDSIPIELPLLDSLARTYGYQNGREVQATNPRDRVFAFLGFASDQQKLMIFPNYHHTVEEVYLDTARALCNVGNLDQFAHFMAMRSDLKLPSWVPDWSGKLLNQSWAANFTADRDYLVTVAPAKAEFRRCRASPVSIALSLKGARLGTVTALGKVFPETESDQIPTVADSSRLEELFADRTNTFVASGPDVAASGAFMYSNGRSMEDVKRHDWAEWMAGVRDFEKQYGSTTFTSESLLSASGSFEMSICDRSRESLHDLHSIEDFMNWHNSMGYHQVLSRFQDCRRPIALGSGHWHVGVGNRFVEVGDQIVQFNGTRVPWVIRELEAGVLRIVGLSRIFGTEQGEFLATQPPIETFTLV